MLCGMDVISSGATLAFVGVIAVPLISFATQFWLSKKNSREHAIRDKQTDFYETVIDLFMNMMNSFKKGNAASDGAAIEWAEKMRTFTPQMILYGSKDFVKA